jgi:hypothetical protein
MSGANVRIIPVAPKIIELMVIITFVFIILISKCDLKDNTSHLHQTSHLYNPEKFVAFFSFCR